jgi:hypothetical protein
MQSIYPSLVHRYCKVQGVRFWINRQMIEIMLGKRFNIRQLFRNQYFVSHGRRGVYRIFVFHMFYNLMTVPNDFVAFSWWNANGIKLSFVGLSRLQSLGCLRFWVNRRMI